jgi:hypothetical protein
VDRAVTLNFNSATLDLEVHGGSIFTRNSSTEPQSLRVASSDTNLARTASPETRPLTAHLEAGAKSVIGIDLGEPTYTIELIIRVAPIVHARAIKAFDNECRSAGGWAPWWI